MGTEHEDGGPLEHGMQIDDLLRRYNELSGWIEDEQTSMTKDPSVIEAVQHHKELDREREIIEEKLDAAHGLITATQSRFIEKIILHEDIRAKLLDQVRDSWVDEFGDLKELDVIDGLDIIHANVRVTKSLEVVDKAKVIAVLVANDKVSEGVKTFAKPFLRKLKDVGILGDDAATYTEKHNLYVQVEKPDAGMAELEERHRAELEKEGLVVE